jgi:hypothetical protein
MPFMQRITWTGIALHAGVLPGQPASHGCVRLPLAFAQQLFGLTDIGMRVVVVREDIVPAEISHPLLFQPDQGQKQASLAPSAGGGPVRLASRDHAVPGSARQLEALKSEADARKAEADAAAKRAVEARRVAARKAAEAAPAVRQVNAAETNLARAEAALQAAERNIENAAKTPEKPEILQRAEEAKAKAASKIAEAQAQLETAKAQAQSKTDAATRAGEEATAAEEARDLAAESAGDASVRTSPVSVFISRKTQRLYIRKAYQPLYEAPIAIRDADKPLGTYVFTALNYPNGGPEARWNVVSMYKAGGQEAASEPQGQRRKGDSRGVGEGAPADVAGAKAALNRLTIPPDALERIRDVVLPGASLIVSDEGPSIETGKDTDFVVVMSGEPQGGLKKRQREVPRYRGDDWWGGGGGGFRFFWD